MIIIAIAVVSGLAGAMLLAPRWRLGYAVSAAVVMLCLGTAVPQATIVETMIAALITGILPVLTAARPIRAHPALWCYVLAVAVGAVSALVVGGLNPFATYSVLLGAGIALVAASVDAAEWKMVWTVVVAVSLIVAVLLILETFVLNHVLFAAQAYGKNPFFSGKIRAQATSGHPLIASFVCVVGLFAVLRADVNIVWKLLLAPVLLAGVLATGSSTTVITGAAGVLGWFLMGRAARLSVLRIALLALLGVGVAILALAPTALLDDVFGNQSAHRLNSIRAIPALIFERPPLESFFGSGFGSAESLYRRGIFDNDGFFAIDNQFVTMLAAAGVLGALLFLVFLTWSLWVSRAQDRVYLLALLMVFFGFDVLASPSAGPLFLIFVASCLTVGRARGRLPAPVATRERSPA